MSTLPVIWSGVILDPSGYGEASRGYLNAMSRTDLTIKVTPKYFYRGDSVALPDAYQVLEKLHGNEVDKTKPYIFLQHLTPEQYLLGAGQCKYHIGMTTFETNTIPGMWQQPLRSMDEVFTFSGWAKGIFESVGIRRPITVIPHGVDVIRFNPGASKIEDIAKHTQGKFVFGANFDWTERKNPGGLIRAFWRAFGPNDDVVLVLKTYNQFAGLDQMKFFHSYLSQIKSEMGLNKTPRVIIFDRMLSSSEMASFYTSLDCYALPSRGEGWCLPYSEAMSCALPVIAVNWSGHTEYMNKKNSYLVDQFKLRPIEADECENQPYYAGHLWADVDIEAFAAAMVHVYRNRDEAKLVGKFAREHMVRHFTWEECAQRMYQRLKEIGTMCE